MTHLLGIDDARSREVGGAVRLSVGLGTTIEDITWLVGAVAAIASDGAAWHYGTSADGADCWPDPDPRPRPTVTFELFRTIAAVSTSPLDVAPIM